MKERVVRRSGLSSWLWADDFTCGRAGDWQVLERRGQVAPTKSIALRGWSVGKCVGKRMMGECICGHGAWAVPHGVRLAYPDRIL